MTSGSGQGSASRSTLPEVRVGQVVDDASSGTSGAGRRSASRSRAALRSKPGGGDQVADEERDAGLGAADGDGCRVHPGQRRQRGLDLAELDAAAADLDLVVGAAVEHQPGVVERHEVAGAVGALPAQRRQRRVLLGVLVGVEVAGQPDAADDQLAGVAGARPGSPAASTTAIDQPASGSPMRTGGAPVEQGGRTRRRWPRWGRRCSRPRGRRPTSRAASSGGQASPPKISSRTCSSASTGHSAASVGTVETTVMRWRTSQRPRSSPLRTSERGAGTRQAP